MSMSKEASPNAISRASGIAGKSGNHFSIQGIANKARRFSLLEVLFGVTALLCFFYALYIALAYANQAPLDGPYSFRQTQTALTAYWLAKNGFSFAYETPVAGSPWSIPFEFPIYQYIVAEVTKAFGCSLDAAGRIVSFAFLVLCVVPVRAIIRDLGLSRLSLPVFATLLFSSPFYLYWGRTFMIETAALFFVIAGIKYFIDIIQSKNTLARQALFLIFMSLSILQKATTGLPVLAILGLVYAYICYRGSLSFKEFVLGKKMALALIYFGIPLAIGVAWTLYTDHVKMSNELGVKLTSSALHDWNWGTLEQRLSEKLYHEVIWVRIFRNNLFGLLGVIILAIPFFLNATRKVKPVILIALAMGILPLFLFTNLHLVHTYYQAANLIFLIFAVSVSLGEMSIGNRIAQATIFVVTVLFAGYHFKHFSEDYLSTIKTTYNAENSPIYAVSQVLKESVPSDKVFVAFGNDWNSSLAYMSERKSFTVPGWLSDYDKIAHNPENYVPDHALGAVAVCTFTAAFKPTVKELIEWSTRDRHWKIGEANGCYIATPEIGIGAAKLDAAASGCQGSIEFAGDKQVGNEMIASISGWIATPAGDKAATDQVYISLTRNGEDPIYLEAMRNNHVNSGITPDAQNVAYRGFSRVIGDDMPAGDYVVNIGRLSGGRIELCRPPATGSAASSNSTLHIGR